MPDVTAPPMNRDRLAPRYIVDGGHIYVRNLVREHRAYYKCWRYRRGCHARIIFEIGTRKVIQSSHVENNVHLGDGCGYELFLSFRAVLDKVNALRARVDDMGTNDVEEIYARLRAITQEDMVAGRVSVCVSKRQIRARMGTGTRKDPNDYDALWTVPHPLDKRRTLSWLRSDIGGRHPMMVFVSEVQADYMASAPIWLIDATFKSAPPGFCQVLNVMGVLAGHNNRYIPLAHVLMSGRRKEDYANALEQVLVCIGAKRRTLSLQQVVMDFESAMWESIPEVIQTWKPRVTVRGCIFHFSQALNRAFKRLVPEKTDWRRREVLALMRFLPYESFPTVQWFIHSLKNRDTGMERFFDYFDGFWMPRTSIWLAATDFESDVFTTCALEGYHGKIGGYMSYRHDRVENTARDLLRLDFTIIGKAEDDQLFQNIRKEKDKRIRDYTNNRVALQSRMKVIIEEFPDKRTLPQFPAEDIELEGCTEEDARNIAHVFDTKPGEDAIEH